jgi:hypothetical protein
MLNRSPAGAAGKPRCEVNPDRETPVPSERGDPHALDLTAPHALPGQAGDKAELKHADDRVVALGHREQLLRIAVDRGERTTITGIAPSPIQELTVEYYPPTRYERKPKAGKAATTTKEGEVKPDLDAPAPRPPLEVKKVRLKLHPKIQGLRNLAQLFGWLVEPIPLTAPHRAWRSACA